MFIRLANTTMIAAAVSVLMAGAALAQSAAPAATVPAENGARAGMAACRADMQTLCASVERGKGKKMACLVENRAKASAECQAAMDGIQARMAERAAKKDGKGARRAAREACKADVQSLCATAEPGRRGIMGCLRQNEAKVSPACSQALAALPVPKRNAGQAVQ